MARAAASLRPSAWCPRASLRCVRALAGLNLLFLEGVQYLKGSMSARDRFFEELQRAIARGFTLATVSVAMSCGPFGGRSADGGPSGGGGGSQMAAGGGGGGGSQTVGGGGGGSQSVPPARDVDGGPLTQVPAGSFMCSGDAGSAADDGGGFFFGSCCTNFHCYQPTNGTCSTAATVSPFDGLAYSPRLPPGSGTCMCGMPAVTGPFAESDGGTTECCYVVGSIGCVGRPLRDGETAIVAAVVARSDWA